MQMLIKAVRKKNKQFGCFFILPLFLSALLMIRNLISTYFWSCILGRIGLKTKIYKGCHFEYPKNVWLGENVLIQQNCEFGSEIELGQLHIRDNVQINRGCKIDYSGGVSIGSNTLISEGVVIITHSHGYNPRSSPIGIELKIGANVWIGANATILQNVSEIGDNAIIASNTVLTKNVPIGEIYGGNPAKFIKSVI